MKKPWTRVGTVLWAALAGTMAHARAEGAADFYNGKTIKVLIGNAAGGGYDQYARTLARHIANYIPGKPTVLPENMNGAGGLTLTRLMATVEPRDGTVFATVQNGIPIFPLLGQAQGFDPTKFGWIGNLHKETSVCVAWHTSPIKTFADLRRHELIVGATGKGADLSGFERPLVNILGAKLRVIYGYESGPAIDLAMQRSELGGRCGISWSSIKLRNATWISEKKVNALIQLGFERLPELSGVPLAQDLAKSADDRTMLNLLLTPQNIGRSYFTPPDVPPERLAILRAAFDATLKDPAFLSDAKSQKMELDPVSGGALQKMIRDVYATPPGLVERAKAAMK